jgi:site-specific recombinase XerD
MKSQYSISIYLDTRRSKGKDKYPVRLRVYAKNLQKQKLYSTKFDFTENEFDSIWNTTKPREKYKKDRLKLQVLEAQANKIAEGLSTFSFEKFEKKLYRKPGEEIKINYQYEQAIAELLKYKQIGTANSYTYSKKSIQDYCENSSRPTDFLSLTFFDITPAWLKNYQKYMIDDNEKSPTTVSIYLRVLRTLFNKVIEEGEIGKDAYPFGRRKYKIPSARKVKKALNAAELAILFKAKPKTRDQEIAKDFWFLSYSCQGINLKDLALLKYENIGAESIHLDRAKTSGTSDSDQRAITIYLNDYSKNIIKKYSKGTGMPKDLLFDIVATDQSPQDQESAKNNFIRYINQHIKKLAQANNLTDQISYQWARHSYATNALRKGASMEFIQEALGHGNLKTTQNYIAGFDDETKREFAKGIMNFDTI